MRITQQRANTFTASWITASVRINMKVLRLNTSLHNVPSTFTDFSLAMKFVKIKMV